MNKTTSFLVGTGLAFSLSSSALAAGMHHDHGHKLKAELSGGQQVRTAQILDANSATVTIPIQGPVTTGAHGKAHFMLSHDKTMLHYKIKAMGFGSTLFMAHIHLGPKGGNGPVMLWLYGNNPNFPRNDGPFTGSISGVLTETDLALNPDLGINSFADAVANIMNGNAYVNLHTTANPQGDIRGQIHKVEKHSGPPFGKKFPFGKNSPFDDDFPF